MPELSFTPEQFSQDFKTVPEGLYKVKCIGFKPVPTKAKDSVNLQPQLEVVGTMDGSPLPQNDDGRFVRVFFNANTKAAWLLEDFFHCFGLPMEERNGKFYPPVHIIGPEEITEATKWEIKSPVIGREGILYLLLEDKQSGNGKKNTIKYFQCGIPDCHTRFPKLMHTKDMTKKSGS